MSDNHGYRNSGIRHQGYNPSLTSIGHRYDGNNAYSAYTAIKLCQHDEGGLTRSQYLGYNTGTECQVCNLSQLDAAGICASVQCELMEDPLSLTARRVSANKHTASSYHYWTFSAALPYRWVPHCIQMTYYD